MYFMPSVSLKGVYNHSGNSDLSLVMFGKARSKALFSIATPPIRINTDSSLGMAPHVCNPAEVLVQPFNPI